jgi:hypothetical protein
MDVRLSVGEKLRRELRSFGGLWEGGYCNRIGDDGPRRLMRVVRMCIEPYAHGATAVEIGCGRGAFTKRIHDAGARKIYCLDALPARHNRFWRYVGDDARGVIDYHQVRDFSCKMLPDQAIEYLFSFDTFCHISLTGIAEYLKNLRDKLVRGANCFVMIADANKYRAFSTTDGRCRPTDGIATESYDGAPKPGRWYWVGTERFCGLLDRFGYRVVVRDVDACPRDPICHFTCG